jgi:ParB-like chromosome segregation protein Spo0J
VSNRIERVSIESLAESGSPRLAGQNEEHARLLAESGLELPPIVVHRPTRRVIDGMHRLAAARLRGCAARPR